RRLGALRRRGAGGGLGGAEAEEVGEVLVAGLLDGGGDAVDGGPLGPEEVAGLLVAGEIAGPPGPVAGADLVAAQEAVLAGLAQLAQGLLAEVRAAGQVVPGGGGEEGADLVAEVAVLRLRGQPGEQPLAGQGDFEGAPGAVVGLAQGPAQ